MSNTTTLEQDTMGRVVTDAVVENLKDLWDAERGMLPSDKVRRVTVNSALVDTGATTLALPSHQIQELGLQRTRDKTAITAHGKGPVAVYEAVRLTIQGRECVVEVMEVPDGVPPLIGQVPLELLDLVVDPQRRRLMGNPEHGGEHALELL